MDSWEKMIWMQIQKGENRVNRLKFDFSNAGIKNMKWNISENRLHSYMKSFINKEMLDMMVWGGWIILNYDQEEFTELWILHQKIGRYRSFLIIGIGGSYLGARAAIEMLGISFYNLLPASRRKAPNIL